MALKMIPDVVSEQDIKTLTTDDTAVDAANMMTEFNISAVIVVNLDGTLAGIVTERDLSRRVVAADRKGSEVRLYEIMTPDPASVSPEETAGHAMEQMRSLRIRHLPVVDEGQVVGIVSIRDLRHSFSQQIVTV